MSGIDACTDDGREAAKPAATAECGEIGGLKRAAFDLPEGVIYLDGNSLGPLPKAAAARMSAAVQEWQKLLVRGWNQAGWIDLPARVGARVGRLIPLAAAPCQPPIGCRQRGKRLAVRFAPKSWAEG